MAGYTHISGAFECVVPRDGTLRIGRSARVRIGVAISTLREAYTSLQQASLQWWQEGTNVQ
jgi:hypothetical protein